MFLIYTGQPKRPVLIPDLSFRPSRNTILILLVGRMGFEPIVSGLFLQIHRYINFGGETGIRTLVPFPALPFQDSAIDRSATSPKILIIAKVLLPSD